MVSNHLSMLKPILELLSSSSEALGFCHRFITGSVPVSFFSSFHSQRIHGSFFFSLFNFQGPLTLPSLRSGKPRSFTCSLSAVSPRNSRLSGFRRALPSLKRLDYLTTLGFVCQVLFSTFFEILSGSLFACPPVSKAP